MHSDDVYYNDVGDSSGHGDDYVRHKRVDIDDYGNYDSDEDNGDEDGCDTNACKFIGVKVMIK